jgi:hypothetical protein
MIIRATGDERDDPWHGELKQFKLTESVKSMAFRYAIKHHLGTTIDSKAIKIRIAPHHFARAALKQFPQLQTSVTKKQIKLVDSNGLPLEQSCRTGSNQKCMQTFVIVCRPWQVKIIGTLLML